MKKIGIITLNGYFNYGNRLQNYALQEILLSMGNIVETIRVERAENPSRFLDGLRAIKRWGISPSLYYLDKNRHRVFYDFSKKYIKETSKEYHGHAPLEGLSAQYDYFVVGSDQVWNPAMNRMAPIFFLTFTNKEKRIAYAPSLGVSEINPDYIEKYKEWISGMHRLSVREDDGAKIIKELTGREAPVLVDPTLLLTREKWISIAKEANNKPKGKYLLTYFLGDIPPEYKKQIKSIVKENNLEVINLGDIIEKETYRTGPSEFIDYINSCSVFCTDSFHGAVFSILMERPFIVYERKGTSLSMYSRINTLLNKFDLNSRKAENIKTNEEVFNIDYSHVPPILEAERKKAFDYLKEALNIEDRI